MDRLSTKSLVPGCNYHTTWQSHKSMRFVLESVSGNWAVMYTRTTGKKFKVKTEDLIFIMSRHNMQKAKLLISKK